MNEMTDNFMIQSLDEGNVTLISSDGVEFSLPHHQLVPCRLIQDALEDEKNGNHENDPASLSKHLTIPILNVTADSLSHIVTFLNHYSMEPIHIDKPLQGETLQDIVTQERYVHFIRNLSQNELFQLTIAANYMDISPLYDLCMLKVSILLMDKSPEEIRNILGLPVLTPEEEMTAREEYPWMFVQEDDSKEHK